jgi:glycosyltransferase involved in cell wall biosynthesis
MSGPLVTIGIPIYKRLDYLENVLKIVRSQDYPHIELLISDNGMNGTKVPEIVKKQYSRPFKFRQNESTVSLTEHFNQIVHAASGYYFVLLHDDDEISCNYVSELVDQLKRHPEASVALSRQEIMNEAGIVIRQSETNPSKAVSGADFVADVWGSRRYKFECVATFLAKTDDIKACGAYPDFRKGSHSDNALLIKLSLNGDVAFSRKCSFRWRVDETSYGWSMSIWDLAADSRQFLRFLENDPTVLKFASAHPAQWNKLKSILVSMAWRTYFNRWNGIYRNRLTFPEWAVAAFAMPPIPAYYQRVALTFGAGAKSLCRFRSPSLRVK